MLKQYIYNGKQYQIADEDLKFYPGAKPIEEKRPKEEKKAEPAKKAKPAPANKSRQTETK